MLVIAVVALQGPRNRGVSAGNRIPGGSSAAAGTLVPTGIPTSPSVTARTTGPSTATAAAHQPLVVLNNTTITGLAQQASHTFEKGGWTVTKYDNYTNDILSTCAYYDPSVAGAQAAANALRAQFPAIKRVKPQFAELAGWHSPIVVILTPDYVNG